MTKPDICLDTQELDDTLREVERVVREREQIDWETNEGFRGGRGRIVPDRMSISEAIVFAVLFWGDWKSGHVATRARADWVLLLMGKTR